ncbi:chitinase [Nocardia sp. NPDC006630]|uniref:chitinase n=1 Tax=Nocardia sp. NPDC006630 TaxID=3157181 RepID=UPI0033B2DB29
MTAQDSSRLITEAEFVAAVTSTGWANKPTTAQYEGMRAATAIGGISTRADLAQFLAQVIYESGGLQYKEELAAVNDPGSVAGEYGDGAPGRSYHGRGYIQLTWPDNYRAASHGIYGDTRLYENPEWVASDEETAWAVSFWYWKTRVASSPGYGKGFGFTTKAINGALECGSGSEAPRQRYEIYTKVAAALGVKALGPDGC